MASDRIGMYIRNEVPMPVVIDSVRKSCDLSLSLVDPPPQVLPPALTPPPPNMNIVTPSTMHVRFPTDTTMQALHAHGPEYYELPVPEGNWSCRRCNLTGTFKSSMSIRLPVPNPQNPTDDHVFHLSDAMQREYTLRIMRGGAVNERPKMQALTGPSVHIHCCTRWTLTLGAGTRCLADVTVSYFTVNEPYTMCMRYFRWCGVETSCDLFEPDYPIDSAH